MTDSPTSTPFWATSPSEHYTIRSLTRSALLTTTPNADVPTAPNGPYDTMSSWSKLDSNNLLLPQSLWQVHDVEALSPAQGPYCKPANRHDVPLLSPARRRSVSTVCQRLVDSVIWEVDRELGVLLPLEDTCDQCAPAVAVRTSRSSVASPLITALPTPYDSAVDLGDYTWSTDIHEPPQTILSDLLDTTIAALEEDSDSHHGHQTSPEATKSHVFILQANGPSDPRTLSSRPPISIRHLAHYSGGSGDNRDNNIWRASALFNDPDVLDLGDWGVPPGSARTWRSSGGRKDVMAFLGGLSAPPAAADGAMAERWTRAKRMLKQSVRKLRRLSKMEGGK